MMVDGALPGEKFLNRQSVTPTGLIEADQSTANSRNYFRLASGNPATGIGWWQISDRQKSSIRSGNGSCRGKFSGVCGNIVHCDLIFLARAGFRAKT
jgi:hypothetical protein